MASWDDPNAWGREHRRLARSALKHLNTALKMGDVKGSESWSVVYSRHSREALNLMQFKRLVILDTDGLAGAKVQAQPGAAQQARSPPQ